jgi:hypothetical protein
MLDAMSTAREILTDDVLREPGLIGPIEMRVVANWERVDRALEGLPHGPITYRWRMDSTGKPALFIEVSVTDPVPSDVLLDYRDRVRSELAEVHPKRSVYMHFVSLDELQRASA